MGLPKAGDRFSEGQSIKTWERWLVNVIKPREKVQSAEIYRFGGGGLCAL